MSERCAIMYSNDNIFDYIELEQDYSIYEIRPMKEWVGKSLRESNIRANHEISVVGIVNRDGVMNITPSPDQPIAANTESGSDSLITFTPLSASSESS